MNSLVEIARGRELQQVLLLVTMVVLAAACSPEREGVASRPTRALAPATSPSPALAGWSPSQRVDPLSQSICYDWFAWRDATTGATPVLLVTGVCEFPSFGYSVELRRKESRATDPRHLIVEKVVLHPVEPPEATTTRLEVRFEEPTPLEYDTVTILPDGVTLQVAATP